MRRDLNKLSEQYFGKLNMEKLLEASPAIQSCHDYISNFAKTFRLQYHEAVPDFSDKEELLQGWKVGYRCFVESIMASVEESQRTGIYNKIAEFCEGKVKYYKHHGLNNANLFEIVSMVDAFYFPTEQALEELCKDVSLKLQIIGKGFNTLKVYGASINAKAHIYLFYDEMMCKFYPLKPVIQSTDGSFQMRIVKHLTE